MVAVISSTTTENPIKSTILGDQLRAAASQYKEIKALEQYLLNQKMSDIRQQSMLLKLVARASLRDSSRDSI